ncbi:MAG: phosphoribosylamine--glycine ligase, partial [Candidatus Dormibacteraeota bacterium]|nr:phosphoribosylamine--glycine ligase [Candidatus Dormibacteraeota bacterium]
MRVLIVGSGGREHALAWWCRRDRDDVEVIVAPGNGGTSLIAENVALDVTDGEAVARLAAESEVDLVVIGPDAAAQAGVADACIARDMTVFGPTADAARIETSKTFAKHLMDRAGIPTARWCAGDVEQRDRLTAFISELGGGCVVKADGLALGKGVTVCEDAATAERALAACFDDRRFGAAGLRVVVEERLEGAEISVLALSDGTRIRTLPVSRDHKRLLDGDEGPNTGGMGAVSPPPGFDESGVEEIERAVLQPCIDALRDGGTPFVGCLYAGLMLTATGPRVLEFNARFGDPEAQVVLPLLAEPALELLVAAAGGSLTPGRVHASGLASTGVV